MRAGDIAVRKSLRWLDAQGYVGERSAATGRPIRAVLSWLRTVLPGRRGGLPPMVFVCIH
jgi:hypothetical protein